MTTAERITLDPVAEDATLRPLDLVGTDPSWGIYLLAHDYPPPKPESQKVSGADVEGDPVVSIRYGNRPLNVKLRIFEPPDPEATNLVTNPSAELANTGWSLSTTGWTGTSREREPAPDALKGNGTDYAFRVKGTHEASVTARFLIFETLSGTSGFPVVAGTTYTFSAYVYSTDPPAGVGGKNILMEIQWYNAAGVALSLAGGQNTLVAGEVKRFSFTGAAPAEAAFAKVRVVSQSNVSGDTVDLWVDRAQLEVGAAATTYFDGDNPGCNFTAARHGSSSFRPAPDGTRFSRIYADVMAKVDRIKRDKVGTYRRVPPAFQQVTYDVRGVEVAEAPQDISLAMKRAEIGLTFDALPGGRGPEVQIGGNFDEVTLPVLTFLAENVGGDMAALGRLQLEDRQGQLQLAAWWGLQQLYYSSATNAELFYQAESRTPLGSTANEAVSGASGGNALQNKKLVNAYQAVMSTQASGGGAHLANVGTFRVFARLYRPPVDAGEVSVKFVWTEGDFVNTTENDVVTFGVDDRESLWTIADLGTVTLDKAPTGSTQRWEGRVMAKSTAANDWVAVDWLWLVPTDEGSGEVRASIDLTPPTALTAFDSYEQTAGALTGKSAALGGVYAVHEGSDTDDFNVDATNDWITRTAVSDTGELMAGISGRAVGLPVNLATVGMAFDFKTSNFNSFVQAFQFLRYKDKNNFIWTRTSTDAAGTKTWIDFNIRVAGVSTFATGTKYLGGGNRTVWQRLTTIIVGEVFFVYLGPKGGTQTLLASGVTSALTALGAGGVYIGDRCGNAEATTRYFDNLEVWEPTLDAAIYANRVLEVDNDRVRRQDVSGLTWGDVPYEGDYLLVPPAGEEKRVSRITAKASRNPDADAGIDDLRGRLFITPRYLMAPPT